MTSKNFQTLSQEQFFLINSIQEEMHKGMLALNSLPKYTVTFYGGARIERNSSTYNQAKALAKKFAQIGWGIVSGGGPGIMAASLEGAREGGGKAVAFRIKIAGEDPIITDPDVDIVFDHFVPRKYALRQSDVLVYAPGGLGTLDELMENLTLMKTNKYPKKPIFLLDKDFWSGYTQWFEKILLEERGTVGADFKNLFKVVDTPEEVMGEMFT
jgi:uncharacterized protein (TIGR00730 family)